MITRHALISEEYLALQKAMHAAPRGYGQRGDKWADAVCRIALQYEAISILDYGAGARTLAAALRLRLSANYRIDEYDPAIPGIDGRPSFADLVVCTDVLEHIEPRKLMTVLGHLKTLARKAVFVVVATRPAKKHLPDGRNAHLIIENAEWWAATVQDAGFTIHPGPPSPSLAPDKEWTAVLTS